MELLTAINGILPVLGEHSVTSITARNPTLNILIPAIERERDEVCQRAFWFNTFDTTLYPDTNGGIAIATDVLAFIPDRVQAAVRGPALFNPDTMDFVWLEPVTGRIVLRTTFDELPESVATLVFYTALITAYATDLGLEGSIRLWQSKADGAMQSVTREHLRQKKYTTRRSPRYQRYINALRA